MIKWVNQKNVLGSMMLILFSGLLIYSNCGQKDGTTGSSLVKPGAPFVSIWQTTTPNESITLPLREGYKYNFSVDWGDESPKQQVTSWNDANKTHEYAQPGEHTITLRGLAEAWYFNNNGFSTCTDPGNGDEDKIISITDLGGMGWKNFEKAFCGCDNLTSVQGGDTSKVTNMKKMFQGAYNAQPDVSNWDTSNVTDMSYMFDGMTSSVDVSNWDTSKVTTMAGMFVAVDFTSNVSNWNTSNVTDMNQMFYLSSFNPNMANWNFANVNNLVNFLTGSNISNVNYTSLLKQIEQTRTVNGVTLNAQGAQYYDSAASARASLIADNSWSISDSGSAGPDPM